MTISEYNEGVASWGGELRIESHEQSDATTVLAVRGELDISSASTMEEALSRAMTAGAEVIVLDLGALEFIDSSGISVLVAAQLRATGEGRRLVLRNLSVQAARVFSVAGLEAAFALDTAA